MPEIYLPLSRWSDGGRSPSTTETPHADADRPPTGSPTPTRRRTQQHATDCAQRRSTATAHHRDTTATAERDRATPAADRDRPDHPHRGPSAHRSAGRGRQGQRCLELGHRVPGHGTGLEGARSARCLGLHPAHLRRLNDCARYLLRARSRKCARHHHSRQRPHHPQPAGSACSSSRIT